MKENFLFGIQESNDADFFGTKGYPEDIIYHFGENQLDEIKAGIKTCYQELGIAKEGLDSYFNNNDMINDEKVAKYFLDEYNEKVDVAKALKWYARLRLGEQIKRTALKIKGIVILGLNYKMGRRGPKYPIFDTSLWIIALGPIF